MLSGLLRILNSIPQPWRLLTAICLALTVGTLLFVLINQVRSCGYNKAQKEYEQQSKEWATERATLLGQIAERDKQISQLEAKEAALIAADQAGKKIDDAIATKIDEVTKAAADEAAVTDAPADCWVRADRTCAKLAQLKPPIVINCDLYKRKLCQ